MPSEGGHRLYVKGRHLSYQRGKRNTNPGTSLIKIEGVDDSQAASFYLGKKVAFVYRARKEVRGSKIRVIWGKITRPHGNSGVRTLRSLEATLTQHPSVKKKAELRAFETAESSNAHLILSLHTQPKAQYHPRASAEGVKRRSPPPIAYNQAPPFATMTRNRRNSMLSFRKASSGSIPKVDATETAKEKAAFHINTKADPTKAINEAQPAARNALEQTTIQSIRTLEHRDAEGNIITDPDRSNPTRPRLERPLDTIRAFEAAIDGSYTRRSSYKADPANPTSPQTIRRSGFFPGYQAQQRSPMDGGGYYGNRNGGSRPDSYIDHSNNSPNQYANGNINGNGNTNGNGNGRQKFGPRNHSDPALFSHANAPSGVYPSHGHQQSYDTVASASNGSHATDQWGNSTDPSSENSSIDRVQPAAKPDIGEAYGFNGFGAGPQFQGPILEEHGQGAPGYGQPGYGQERVADGNGFPYQGNGAPIPPPHAPSKENAPRVPIKLGGSSGSGNAAPVSKRPAAPVDTEKRKSWLKRRFSKG